MNIMDDKRFDRNIRFFGKEGQEKLAKVKVTLCGAGGLGTHVLQQLALLGVGSLTLIDNETIEETNRNRYITIRHVDTIPCTSKVQIGKRLVNEVNPDVKVVTVPDELASEEAFEAIISADYVFGCLDKDAPRMILNELCTAYEKPYIDIASDIIPGESPDYGGRVCISWDGNGCLDCFDLLDKEEIKIQLESKEARQDRAEIYGVPMDDLDEAGPSVVSINGVIASIGVTEFMLWVTGIRMPNRVITYNGKMGIVTLSKDLPAPDCYYCKELRGKSDSANVRRYLNMK
jgi:molybdopterin/thiamine biosynthesis adenylyltransferase